MIAHPTMATVIWGQLLCPTNQPIHRSAHDALYSCGYH
jgi:hypothetical protein